MKPTKLENTQFHQSATSKVNITYNTGYLAYLPKDYTLRNDWPMLVFLHGIGERGSDLDLVTLHGPPKLINEGQEFPFVVISPQCREDEWWDSAELDALMDQLVVKYNVDESRLYLTGLSMGGYGAWALATHNPNRFAALAPVCGGGNRLLSERLVNTPIWAFHGAKDPVVPLHESERMVEAINKKGGNALLTIYPDATHNSWTRTYDNPALYEWLLQQQK
ncbi:MAG: prolyl oligopeptidase family serine peptidase [Sumerlaeia bacterium]